MTSDIEKLRKEAIALATQAVQFDLEKKYEEAIKYYIKAGENLNISASYESKMNQDTYRNKAKEYLNRAQKLQELNVKENNNNAKFTDVNKKAQIFEWNNKGNSFSNLKKYEEALNCYNEALKIDPNNDICWNNKGFTLSYLEKYEEALDCYNEALKMNKHNVDSWNSKGYALLCLKKYQEALCCFDETLKKNPKNADFWNNKGNALYNLKRYQEALNSYDNAIKNNPNNPDFWNNKGYALSYLERYKEALDCCERALKINQNNDKYWSSKGTNLFHLKRFQEALTCYDEALRIDPLSNKARLQKAILLLSRNKVLDAKCSIENLNSEAKDNKKLFYIKGLISMKESKFSEAMDFFIAALKEDDSYLEALTAKGECFIKLGESKEALNCFNELLKTNQSLKEAYLGKGNYYRNMNQINQAIHYYGEAIKIDPDFKEAYLNLSLCYKQSNNILKSIENLNEVIEIDPYDTEMFELRGDLYLDLEDFEVAIKDYDAALELEKHNDNFLSKKIEAEQKLLKQKEEAGLNTMNPDRMNFGDFLTEQVRWEIDDNDFSKDIPNETILFDNEKIKGFENNEKSRITEIQRNFHKFKKLQLQISSINPKEIKGVQDKKDLEFIQKDLKELETEATRVNTTFNGDITVADKTVLNKTSYFLKEKVVNMEKILMNLNQKYKDINNKVNLFEERVSAIESELEKCLKDFENKILSKLKKLPAEELRKIEDYIYGFKITLSNVFVVSQVIETNLTQINNSSAPMSILSCGVSLIPIFGGSLRCGIKTIWQFFKERKVKKNAKKILQLSHDGSHFSQKIGSLLEAIFDDEYLRKMIISTSDSLINKNSVSFFGRIKAFFKEISDKIQAKLYTDLYNTPKKKLGFLNANLILENIYNEKIEMNKNFNSVVVNIIKKEFELSYDSIENSETNENQTEKVRSKCCLVF